jgi:hypothetical protein
VTLLYGNNSSLQGRSTYVLKITELKRTVSSNKAISSRFACSDLVSTSPAGLQASGKSMHQQTARNMREYLSYRLKNRLKTKVNLVHTTSLLHGGVRHFKRRALPYKTSVQRNVILYSFTSCMLKIIKERNHGFLFPHLWGREGPEL